MLDYEHNHHTPLIIKPTGIWPQVINHHLPTQRLIYDTVTWTTSSQYRKHTKAQYGFHKYVHYIHIAVVVVVGDAGNTF